MFKGNNRSTTVINGETHYVLHATSIVIDKPKSIQLDNGGYKTAVSKKAMNEVGEFLGFSVFQKAKDWYVNWRGDKLDFYNGIELPKEVSMNYHTANPHGEAHIRDIVPLKVQIKMRELITLASTDLIESFRDHDGGQRDIDTESGLDRFDRCGGFSVIAYYLNSTDNTFCFTENQFDYNQEIEREDRAVFARKYQLDPDFEYNDLPEHLQVERDEWEVQMFDQALLYFGVIAKEESVLCELLVNYKDDYGLHQNMETLLRVTFNFDAFLGRPNEQIIDMFKNYDEHSGGEF